MRMVKTCTLTHFFISSSYILFNSSFSLEGLLEKLRHLPDVAWLQGFMKKGKVWHYHHHPTSSTQGLHLHTPSTAPWLPDTPRRCLTLTSSLRGMLPLNEHSHLPMWAMLTSLFCHNARSISGWSREPLRTLHQCQGLDIYRVLSPFMHPALSTGIPVNEDPLQTMAQPRRDTSVAWTTCGRITAALGSCSRW